MSTQPPPAIVACLLPDEKMLWWDRPSPGLVLTPRDSLLIPFSLLWGGFAIFWEYMVITSNAAGVMALWGVPFVLIGLFLIFGRFWLDAWLRARTFYALTDQRALIVRAGPWASFKAIKLDRLPEATLNERGDGRGTISFGPRVSFLGGKSGTAGGLGVWIPALDPTPQFAAIKDARRVFAVIQGWTQRAGA